MRVLVVDDERAVRESLRRALELEGYDVELAGDGQEALDRLEAGPDPDAVILDVLMPAVDGLEVCTRLRRSGSRLPVLMLTARAEVENRVAGSTPAPTTTSPSRSRSRSSSRGCARSCGGRPTAATRRCALPTSSSTRARER